MLICSVYLFLISPVFFFFNSVPLITRAQLFTALADKMRHVPSDKSVSRGMSNWIDMLFGAEMRSSLSYVTIYLSAVMRFSA